MKIIKWLSSYEVGNDHIDKEHKIFLGLIQKLAADVESDTQEVRINRTFREVIKYAEFHFLSEENLMLDVGYPEYPQHKVMHEFLLEALNTNFQKFENDQVDLREIVTFLFEWFVKHTVSEDIKIGAFIGERRSNQTLST
jgi:hemerythrin